MGNIADPGMWAEHGGILGLIILVLFTVLYLLAKITIAAITKIYELHRVDLKQMMEMHVKEREEWIRVTDDRQKETNLAINAMTAAINRMQNRRREIINEQDS